MYAGLLFLFFFKWSINQHSNCWTLLERKSEFMSLSESGGCVWWCSDLGCSCFDCLVCVLQCQRWGKAPVLLEWEHIWPLEKKVRGQHLAEVVTRSSFLREPVLIPPYSEWAQPRGAAEAAAGGEDLQSLHGQAGVHRIHPLRSPGGVWRLRHQPTPLPYLQGCHPRQRPCLHVLRLTTKNHCNKTLFAVAALASYFLRVQLTKTEMAKGHILLLTNTYLHVHTTQFWINRIT